MLSVWPENRMPSRGRRDRRSSAGTGRRRGEAGRVFWWVLGIGTLVVILAFAALPFSHGHGHRVIRVTGQLVAEGTGEPVVGARVLTVSQDDLETEWDPESAWFDVEAIDAERKQIAEAGYEEDLGCAVGLYDNAGTRSGVEGRVDLLVGLPSTTYFSTLFTHADVDGPQEGVAALWIAPDGHEPVIVRLDEGRFRQNPDGEDHPVWGTYDLGTVMVPLVAGR